MANMAALVAVHLRFLTVWFAHVCFSVDLQVAAKIKETGLWATTSQNSFNASWHRFYKCPGLHWRDAVPFLHKKCHHLVFC
jgi:hypothetical protein